MKMTKLALNVNLDLTANLTEAEIDSLTSELIFSLSKHAISETVSALRSTHVGTGVVVNMSRTA